MKTRKTHIAILAMAILVTMVAVVSCKKENENALTSQKSDTQRTVDRRQIGDMIAYLKDFKQQLLEGKSDEAMNLEDAAWHLASLANIDFCNVNVEYNDVQFDTIEIKVNVTDGVVLMGDMRTAYEQMCTEIQNFKKEFNHCDQNMYFVNVSIGDNGFAKIALMTSFTSASKYIYYNTWYFEDTWTAIEQCGEYFSEDSTYIWNTNAASELQRVLNLFEHHSNYSGPYYGTISYIPSRSHTFDYTDYTNCHDPYGSNFEDNSRVFAIKASTGPTNNYAIPWYDMCYCLDSYLGLGYDYVDNTLYPNEHPVNWTISSHHYHPLQSYWHHFYHQLHVEYGQLYPLPPVD